MGWYLRLLRTERSTTSWSSADFQSSSIRGQIKKCPQIIAYENPIRYGRIAVIMACSTSRGSHHFRRECQTLARIGYTMPLTTVYIFDARGQFATNVDAASSHDAVRKALAFFLDPF